MHYHYINLTRVEMYRLVSIARLSIAVIHNTMNEISFVVIYRI